MDIQNYRLDNSNLSNTIKKSRPTRRSQERQAKREQMGVVNPYSTYLRKESLVDCFVMLSNAVREKNTGKVFDAIEIILKRAKSPNFSDDPEQIEYVKKRITDALVEVYRSQIVRQYEIIKNNEMYFSNVPSNFSENLYKYDPEARKRAKARDILEDKYRTSIYGGYMTKVIDRILKEHEESKCKTSPIKKTPGVIQAKIPDNKEAYIEKMKKEIKRMYDRDDDR